MEVILGVLIGIAALFGIVFTRLITTFVHEFGHAISALAFSDGPVEMYVGSYGDESKSLRFRIGRLTIYLSFIIWDLDIGLCRNKGRSKRLQQMIILLSGPVLSLLLGLFFLFLMTLDRFSDGQKFVLAIFMVSSIWDFFVNVVPRNSVTTLHNGAQVYNDGHQFMTLVREKQLPESSRMLINLAQEGDPEEALTLANKLIKENPKVRAHHEVKLDLLSSKGNYKELIEAFDFYLEFHDPTLYYVGQWADAKLKLHEYDEVVQKLTKIIYEGKGNYDLYFLRGKALMELGEYHDAMRDFHALTLGKVEDPRALANRAYCQYRLGYEEEAREDVVQAIEQGKSHMGEIYYLAGVIFEKHDEERALHFYKKAQSLKYDHHALAFNISRIEKYK